MDARAKSKALFKSKLNARMQEKQKIDSPLVRYNEHDQLVCRVCDVIVKSESLWPAHQASRKHHESLLHHWSSLQAVDNLKVKASAVSQTNNVQLESAKDLQKPRKLDNKNEPPVSLHQREPSSSLPSDFFDGRGPKRPKLGMIF
ncbi:hypothetical protein M569_01833 [Genlisea aurea]|uniref:C2H2-type domain-containing protein n=1 Tax=Genlisea aurea TaxID=192259 RepID=S8EAN8_9LAMI|nr:hypothetical protein M569_01833 [Genlisea aurea]